MPTPQETIKQALEAWRGDSYIRFKLVTKDMPDELLDAPIEWQGGVATRRQVLAAYKAHDDNCKAALEWLEGKK